MIGDLAWIHAELASKYKAGGTVVARNNGYVGYTWLPRHFCGKSGIVEKDHGVFGFTDRMAYV